MAIDIRLDHVLLDRRMTLTELVDRVGITVCRELDCQPGDLLTHVPDDELGRARARRP